MRLTVTYDEQLEIYECLTANYSEALASGIPEWLLHKPEKPARLSVTPCPMTHHGRGRVYRKTVSKRREVG